MHIQKINRKKTNQKSYRDAQYKFRKIGIRRSFYLIIGDM